MGYLDYEFYKGDRSFITHKEVLEFLNDYADNFNLRKNIQVRFMKFLKSLLLP